ncbi:MAG: hypothetical protein JRK26_19065 [Deltaproteobacteria bacterium]|nr:hypothetical protein [Deltaproteobacteria bacterium]
MDIDADTVLQALKSYQQQIREMDRKVTLYLSNRSKYPHPRHEELIEEIRRFENKIYRINFGFAHTEVQLRLEGLLHSLLVHERSWKRLFERDAEDYEKRKTEEQSHPLVEKVYSWAQRKWAQSGSGSMESKREIAARLLPAYLEAKKNLKKGQKIKVTYDPETKQVKFTVRTENSPS